MHIFAIVAAVLLIIGMIVLSRYLASRRREALAALAAKLGMRFYPDKDRDFAERVRFLDQLNQGSNRYVYNRLSGRWQGHDVMAFDFHYERRTGKNTRHYHFTVATLQLARSFPELIIAPEDIFSKIAQSFGYEDIDFESAEFSRAFCVRSPDKKFAYAVCHPRMMEHLLAHRDLALELDGNLLAIASGTHLAPAEIEAHFRQLVEIRDLLPDYLFTEPSS